MKTYLFPYNMGSQGAKELSRSLGIKRIKREGSRFRGAANKRVINWGNASLPDQVASCQVVNPPAAVNKAGNKLLSFQAFQAYNEGNENAIINFPEFTTDVDIAKEWVNEGGIAVARTVLRGHSGDGIVLLGEGDEWVAAPLFVKYVKKTQEYRVHVLRDTIIDMQRKARRADVPDEEVNWQVRNHSNGFIFMREGVELPEEALEQAKRSLVALGLDFGAVDLIYNERQDKYYVIEVNSAPGLTGTTLERYKEAFDGF